MRPPQDASAVGAAMQLAGVVAIANYPKGVELQLGGPRPQIDQRGIWSATEAYVDKGMGTLDGLFRTIWGMSVDQYLAETASIYGERGSPEMARTTLAVKKAAQSFVDH